MELAVNKFAAEVYQELVHLQLSSSDPEGESTGNLLISPLSLHTILGMATVAANDETRTEMLTALHLDKTFNDEDIVEFYSHTLSKLIGQEDLTFGLLTANKIYTLTGFEITPEFEDRMREKFFGDVEQLDVATRIVQSVINHWVESHTCHKIKDIIPGDEPLELEAYEEKGNVPLVLVNTLHFMAQWESPFYRSFTSKGVFHVTAKKSVEVEMMKHSHFFPYASLPEVDADVVMIPFEQRFSMVIILPRTVDGLPKLQSEIDSILNVREKRFIYRVKAEKVNLSLPRFRIEAAHCSSWKKVLQSLGFRKMFQEGNKEFRRMRLCLEDEEPLPTHVSTVIQKTFIKITEKGSDVSMVTFKSRANSQDDEIKGIDFAVDRPFYFQIVDTESNNLVLLCGHCNDPTATQ